jgi:hypothetical protein
MEECLKIKRKLYFSTKKMDRIYARGIIRLKPDRLKNEHPVG